MTKINIFSGFLGAGKTTLIQKLINEGFNDKICLIENEFGEIAIDGGFMKEAGVQVKEINSGCICCSLVGDFEESLKQVMETYNPDRIIIEPSGVGKLSDVKAAVSKVCNDDVVIDGSIAVVHAKKCKMYARNYGEFFIDQIAHADCIVLSRSQDVNEKKLQETIDIIREHNPKAPIVTTPWDKISGEQILDALHHSELLNVDEV
ncbi:MAG: GTP-binding protein, partial [Anaerovibrio sp.]|nr:GTP-binding protein [Anaerovibrio sp.]